MVKAALKHAEEKHQVETHFFSVARKDIKFCIHCDHCVRTKKGCAFKDDMTQVYSLMERADAWIVGTPCISGQCKCTDQSCS